MNVTEEIKTLQTVVEALTPLVPDARQRVIDYACNMLGIGRNRAPGGEGIRREDAARPPAPQNDKPKAAQQYLRDYNYKIMTKRIAVVAVYLERERGMKRFSLRDLTEAFRDAKESKMPAYSQYARAIAMGFLAKEGDQHYATSKAEALVDNYAKRSPDESSDKE